MNVDALTVGAVCRELRATVLGGRVQHVHHPGALAVALEVYAQGKTWWVYGSAHPEQARVHLVSRRPPRLSDAVTPLLLLLRKYVDGARIDDIAQPPLERVLRIAFSRRARSGELWRTELVLEVMGRLSNAILLDADGTVMDALKRVPATINRVRTVLPQRRYDPPPAQQKLDPRTLRCAALAAAVDAGTARKAPSTAAGALVSYVSACSPLLAREAVYRAHERLDVPVIEADWQALAETMTGIWADAGAGRLAPSVAVEGDRIVAYAAYPLRSFPAVEPVGSMSAALERWYAQGAPPAPPVDAARRATLRRTLLAAQDRLRAKRYSLERSRVDEDEVERLRKTGEQLLTIAAQVQPGQDAVSLPDGETVSLDTEATPVELAQRLFARYRKGQAALREVPALLAGVEDELRYLDEALVHLDLAATPAEIADLRAEWAEAGYLPAPEGARGKTKAGGKTAAGKAAGRRSSTKRGGGRPRDGAAQGAPGYRRVVVGGFEVLVGRSGRGNDTLVSREARPGDLWLHARGVPGAHVLIRSSGRDVPAGVVERAASLAAGLSQARHAPVVGVDVAPRRNVHRIKGAPPGLVRYHGERTLYVTPAPIE